MLLKGRQAEAFARRPDPDIWAVLAFGEDEGLAADAARSLIAAWDKVHPVAVSVLDEEAVRKEPALLFDALEAVSLLGDQQVIRLRTSGDKIAGLLAEAIDTGDTQPGRYAARLVIEAGSLPVKSKLRTAAEAARRAACLQLFEDTASDIEGRVKASLLEAGATIEADALALFLGDLPGHRAIANMEIEKLCLYARGLGRPLKADDVRSLSGTDIDHDMSGVITAALGGEAALAHRTLDRLAEAGTSPISVLRSLQFEAQRMLAAHEKIASGETNPGKMLRPPVWQSDWPAFRGRLGKWPVRRLVRLLERIYEAERNAKLASGTGDAIVRMLINDVARAAAPA